jgi:hypothetical protein
MNVSTTSSKPAPDLLTEVLRVLSLYIEYGAPLRFEHDKESAPWVVVCDVMDTTLFSVISEDKFGQVANNGRKLSQSLDSDENREDETTTESYSSAHSAQPPSRTSTGSAPPPSKVSVTFQVEVCKVPRLNLYGLHFKRMNGGVWSYKKVCGLLLSQMNI